ncbi:hypothetical protein K458DRAFT_431736 [Lentithecium fluviatile CBS 122367]|uniref:Extracellular membrane protein CFEM domain-containing protein n=1 Tax=Lentithecium fluviatile CBS 122367 TaxID=1168545 RepID=A0A6G1J1J2_9PLEO|nr:hypothetical protein K458DRAFT_431736 [Lentithecium fluviatile CBS 122367]
MRCILIPLACFAITINAVRIPIPNVPKPNPQVPDPFAPDQGPVLPNSNPGGGGGGRPNPNQAPDVPPNEGPVVPNGNPGRGGGSLGNPNQAEALTQEKIELNMGKVEQNLRIAGDVKEVAQVMLEVVSAILEDPDCADEGDCPKPAFAPTTTLPTASFEKCTSYAAVLSACASATPAFYALAPTVQASCACYTHTSFTMDCSGPAETMTKTATATFAAQIFDIPANVCRDYFRRQGYEALNKALDGTQGNSTVLGAGFCQNLDSEVRNQGNRSVGLKPALETVWVKSCAAFPTSKAQAASGATGLALTRFDRYVLTMLTIAISTVLGCCLFEWGNSVLLNID